MSDLSPLISTFNHYFDSGAIGSAYRLFPGIADEFLRNLFPFSTSNRSDPRYLVHYTSLDTLFSLLDRDNSGYLRLYDTVHSNDPIEGSYFHTHLKEVAYSNYSQLPPIILSPSPEYAYVSSFIIAYDDVNIDKLVYWLAYGRNGHGCSIAIPYPDFSPNLHILPIRYGTSAVIETADELVSFLGRFSTNFQTPPAPFQSTLQPLAAIPYLHKSASYSYEAECRLLQLPSDFIGDPIFELRAHPASSPIVRHYVEHPSLHASNIFISGTVITLGPAVTLRENVRRAIRALLRHHGLLTGPRIAYSEHLYRPASL